MIDRRDINTEGGDYREIINSGQYAEGNIYNYPPTPPESRDRSEAKLLAAVKNEVAGRLAQSLHNRVYIELNKEEDPSQVIQPWAVDVKLGSQPSQHCPEGTNIVDIFDKPEIGGKLLILGAPGSGKTMMLLQLAEELVRRAEGNAAVPVPVLLNLSAWKQEFKDIPSWMVADLKLKYGVRQDIAKKWIEEGRVIPLLDGLDELMSNEQEKCVLLLNIFLSTDWSGLPLVVCSRVEEYESYKAKLGLNGSVTLKPLTNGQIQKFLLAANCEWLWTIIHNDSQIMDQTEGLARSILMLTLLTTFSDEVFSAKSLVDASSNSEKVSILFDHFILLQLNRRHLRHTNMPNKIGNRKTFKDNDVKKWLWWLASLLKKENQTEFFIENLQPYYIGRYERFVYGFTFGLLIGILGGLIACISFGFLLGIYGGLIFGLIFGIILGSLGGNPNIKCIENINLSNLFSPDNIKENLISIFFGGLIGWQFAGVPGMLLYAIGFGLIFGLSRTISSSEIETRSTENQGIQKSLKNASIFGGGLIFWGGLSAIFIRLLDISSVAISTFDKAIPFICFLGIYNTGLSTVLEHLSLRITLWLFGYSPLNYSKFLRYCTERGFLQRVGGGYRFVHALLRDHFATQYIPK